MIGDMITNGETGGKWAGEDEARRDEEHEGARRNFFWFERSPAGGPFGLLLVHLLGDLFGGGDRVFFWAFEF
jgi:hypothetical protein